MIVHCFIILFVVSRVVSVYSVEDNVFMYLLLKVRIDNVYRASFCQTFAEINAPTGEWKQVASATLLIMWLTAAWVWWCEHYVFSKQLPESMTEEYKKKNIERMIKQGQEEMTGISAQYDFENKKWKGNKWW